ncbi:hypothetical protein NYY70_20215, partial [Acinetobacter baumannii]|nr:hypothetical protein [Acinetobacter baumannii]
TITADASDIVFTASNGTVIKGVALGPEHEGLRVLDQLRDPTERMFSTDEELSGFVGWYKDVTTGAKEQYRRLMKQSQTSLNILERLQEHRFGTNANPFS